MCITFIGHQLTLSFVDPGGYITLYFMDSFEASFKVLFPSIGMRLLPNTESEIKRLARVPKKLVQD
jgi:hypothetical protein